MKKKFQEKKMLEIVDNHIEWDKTTDQVSTSQMSWEH